MEFLEFKSWWKEFMYNHEKDNDNGHSMMNELNWTLNGYSEEKRISFINHLMLDDKLYIASNLIPTFGNSRQKRQLRLILLKKLLFTKNSDKYDYLLISVFKTYNSSDSILIRLYFLINKNFNCNVLSELFILNKGMFLEFFDKMIKRLRTKSFALTVFFRDDEIKDYLIKHGNRKILLIIQSLDNDIRLIN